MNKIRFYPFYLFIFLSFYLFISCTHDAYDSGDGEYSYLCAEFAELKTTTAKLVPEALTDDNEQLTFSHPLTVSWAEKGDTVYRALLYYNKVTETTAEPVSLGAVPTLKAKEHWKLEEQPEDPVGVESAWLSKKGKYLNLGLLLKTGQADDNDGTQTVGLAQDTILLNGDQTHTAVFRLLHDQCEVPQYYTSRRFVSILLPDTVQLDTIRLTIPTYEGKLERIFLP